MRLRRGSKVASVCSSMRLRRRRSCDESCDYGSDVRQSEIEQRLFQLAILAAGGIGTPPRVQQPFEIAAQRRLELAHGFGARRRPIVGALRVEIDQAIEKRQADGLFRLPSRHRLFRIRSMPVADRDGRSTNRASGGLPASHRDPDTCRAAPADAPPSPAPPNLPVYAAQSRPPDPARWERRWSGGRWRRRAAPVATCAESARARCAPAPSRASATRFLRSARPERAACMANSKTSGGASHARFGIGGGSYVRAPHKPARAAAAAALPASTGGGGGGTTSSLIHASVSALAVGVSSIMVISQDLRVVCQNARNPEMMAMRRG